MCTCTLSTVLYQARNAEQRNGSRIKHHAHCNHKSIVSCYFLNFDEMMTSASAVLLPLWKRLSCFAFSIASECACADDRERAQLHCYVKAQTLPAPPTTIVKASTTLARSVGSFCNAIAHWSPRAPSARALHKRATFSLVYEYRETGERGRRETSMFGNKQTRFQPFRFAPGFALNPLAMLNSVSGFLHRMILERSPL